MQSKTVKFLIEKQPILSFFMPDAIDTFSVADQTYIVTPNEGDARDYDAYSEEKKLSKIGKAVKLKAEHYAGYTQEELDAFDLTTLADYKVTIENGLSADGTTYEALYGYGGRVSLSSKPIQWNWYMTAEMILKQSLLKTCQNNSILVMIN